MVPPSTVASSNRAIWDIAVQKALEVLPFEPSLGQHRDLAEFVESNDRVAGAVRDFEQSLTDTLVPILRDEVEQGRLSMSGSDDYRTVSADLAAMLVAEWLVIDLRD